MLLEEVLTNDPENLRKGTVKRVTSKWFAFIEPDIGDEDIFFHFSQLRAMEEGVGGDINSIRKGVRVTFKVVLDQRSQKKMAADVHIIENDDLVQEEEDLEEDLKFGVVKNISSRRGFAFVFPADGGARIFLHSAGLKSKWEFEDLREGDEVSYKIKIDERSGKEMAIRADIVKRGPEPQKSLGPEPGDGVRRFGEMIHVMTDGGWGFVAPDDGSERLFLHSSGMRERGSFDNLARGDRVSFELTKDRRSGKPMAGDVEVLSVGKRRGEQVPWGGVQTGIVKNINYKKGFAFVRPVSGGITLFFHGSSFAGDFEKLKDRDKVVFERGFDEWSRRNMAVNVREA